jgi:hypothetical protein
VRDLGRVFDTIKESLPNVPGISDMLDVYSQAIGAIADSVAKIEAAVQQSNDTMREFQKSGGDDIGIAPVYIRAEGPRAKLAGQKLTLLKMLGTLDTKLDEMKCHRPGSPLTPNYSGSSCPEKGKVRPAIEFAMRELAKSGLESKRKEAEDRLSTAQENLRLQQAASKAHDEQLRTDRQAIKEAERTVAKLVIDVEHEQFEEKFAKDADTANEHKIKRITLEQYLDKAKKGRDGARAALTEDEAKSPEFERALTAATQEEAKLNAEIKDLTRQISEVIRNAMAQAAVLDNWDDGDYAILLLCLDISYLNDRFKAEFKIDKIVAARKVR